MQTFNDQKFTGILSKDDTKNAVFVRCVFQAVVINEACDVIFKDCEFHGCVFRSKTNLNDFEDVDFKNVAFQECFGSKIEFKYCTIKNLKIVKPVQNLEWNFIGARVYGALEINDCKNLMKISIDSRCSFGEDFFELISDSKIPFLKKIFLWNIIEFIQSLRLPQVGISIAIFVSFLASILHLGLLDITVDINLGDGVFYDGYLNFQLATFKPSYLAWCSAGVLFISVIHLAIRPEECSVTSNSVWRDSHGRSSLQLLWFRKQNSTMRHILICSYIGLSAFVAYGIFSKLFYS